MPVLKLNGLPIDWDRPPKPTDRVLWSERTTSGRPITGSLRTIAHLDTLNEKSKIEFGVGISVMQPPYNTGVAASAGTHDYDACVDVRIDGVGWAAQRDFFRENGLAGWVRVPPAFVHHYHGFTLPPRDGKDVSDDFRTAGLKVGLYVDGGWSTRGRRVASSQIDDYYRHRNGLSGHAHDPTPYPKDIEATIFNLQRYIEERRSPVAGKKAIKGLSWNVLTGRSGWKVRGELIDLIRSNGRPKFVALQEVRTYRSVLTMVAATLRYRKFQPKDDGRVAKGVDAREAGSTALLVRRGTPVREHGAIRCTKTWKGPRHGLIREGRVLPWVVAKVSGRWTLVVSVHMPTGKHSARNEAAWNETMQKIAALVERKNLPCILVGDWNDKHDSRGTRSPRGLARHIGGRVEHSTPHLDYAVVQNQPVRVTAGSKRGSDHPAIRIVRK